MTIEKHTDNHLAQLLAYKRWMDLGIYDAVKQVQQKEKPELLRNALYFLNHLYIVDQIFQAHLMGRPHGFITTESDTFPPVQELSELADNMDRWLIAYASTLTNEAGAERISFTFTDGAPGVLSRAEMLMHLVTHSLYHISVINNELAREKAVTSPVLLTTYHASVV